MDIADTSVAILKEIDNEGEKLCEKVIRQTAELIELRVAQDVEYWDLKEKYEQLEREHEELQQNMMKLQLQHEAISGQYQEELKLRLDTINNTQTTREAGTVLQQYCDPLKNTLFKCILDQNILSQAFMNSGALVKQMKIKQNKMDKVYKRNVVELGAQLEFETAHHSQTVEQYWSASKHSKEKIIELKSQISSLTDLKEKIENELQEENNRGDKFTIEVETFDRMVIGLQTEMRSLIHEADRQDMEMTTIVATSRNEHKVYVEKLECLETAVKNQAQFTETVKSENDHLQDMISAYDDAIERLEKELQQSDLVIEEYEAKFEKLSTYLNDADSFRSQLEIIVQEKEKSLEHKSLDISTLKDQITDLENDQLQTNCHIEDLSTMCQQTSEEKKRLQEKLQGLDETVAQCSKNYKDKEIFYKEKVEQLTTTIGKQETQLCDRAVVILRLRNDGVIQKERTASFQHKLDELSVEIKSKEKKIASGKEANALLTDKIKEKDREFTEQRSLILELESEEERLEIETRSLHNTINNIQKEVTELGPRQTSTILEHPPQKRQVCDFTMSTVPKSSEEPPEMTSLVYEQSSDDYDHPPQKRQVCDFTISTVLKASEESPEMTSLVYEHSSDDYVHPPQKRQVCDFTISTVPKSSEEPPEITSLVYEQYSDHSSDDYVHPPQKRQVCDFTISTVPKSSEEPPEMTSLVYEQYSAHSSYDYVFTDLINRSKLDQPPPPKRRADSPTPAQRNIQHPPQKRQVCDFTISTVPKSSEEPPEMTSLVYEQYSDHSSDDYVHPPQKRQVCDFTISTVPKSSEEPPEMTSLVYEQYSDHSSDDYVHPPQKRQVCDFTISTVPKSSEEPPEMTSLVYEQYSDHSSDDYVDKPTQDNTFFKTKE